jgi:hypothetical protein
MNNIIVTLLYILLIIVVIGAIAWFAEWMLPPTAGPRTRYAIRLVLGIVGILALISLFGGGAFPIRLFR